MSERKPTLAVNAPLEGAIAAHQEGLAHGDEEMGHLLLRREIDEFMQFADLGLYRDPSRVGLVVAGLAKFRRTSTRQLKSTCFIRHK